MGLRTWLPFGFLAVVACTATQRSAFSEPPAPGAADASTPAPPPSGGGGFGGDAPTPVVAASLDGTVFAPNGTLPMANALVYVTSEEPSSLPTGAYCDTCVALAEGTFASTSANGSFSIATELRPGDAWVVVQKGQFRRATKVTVAATGGALSVPKSALTLPGRADPSRGDSAPKMLVLKDRGYDEIEQSLAKLGITGIEVRESRAPLDNLAELMKYQIVFLPCGSKDDVRSQSDAENLQAFVAAGGRLYVTDWSYEFVRQPFAGHITWKDETPRLGSAAAQSSWDAPGAAADPGLGDWLAASGDASFEVEGSYTTILGVNELAGIDAAGQPKIVTPKVWVTATKPDGNSYPTTVSFEHQCGRVLFSTYHTERNFGSELHAQEKALLYVLLEVGVCIPPEPGVE